MPGRRDRVRERVRAARQHVGVIDGPYSGREKRRIAVMVASFLPATLAFGLGASLAQASALGVVLAVAGAGAVRLGGWA